MLSPGFAIQMLSDAETFRRRCFPPGVNLATVNAAQVTMAREPEGRWLES
jgi:hypothetical protein